MKEQLHIGIDDTDSTRKGCTTYVAALLVEKLEQIGVKFLDYPDLFRLNPNVPWKTRGNGALCIRIQYESEMEDQIKELGYSLVEEHSDLSSVGTNPGVVLFKGTALPEEIMTFAKDATIGIVTLESAFRIIKKFNCEALGFKSCRGIIGALAAIGSSLKRDHTYELIAYRAPENYGLRRKVDEESIFEMDRLTQPYTFNNVDNEKGRVVITPRGPDPILFGLRGETPEIVKKAFALVEPLERVARWVIFRTNQGTDAHLKRINALNKMKEYNSVIVKGVVAKNPRAVPLRHVIFSIRDDREEVDCAAYEPTGTLRKVAAKLTMGDTVEVYGAVRKSSQDRSLTINLEKIRVLALASKVFYQNPLCQKCGKRLKSMGKNQGFKCKKCGSKYPGLEKVAVAIDRGLEKGLYITSTRSQRHLTKPLRRYGLEKHSWEIKKMTKTWHSL